ncbi:MAG: J domain-containing protein [Alphaproteobacteria bacterium]|nr:J domain-containing protein [Alphaproteobacteria bacterium]
MAQAATSYFDGWNDYDFSPPYTPKNLRTDVSIQVAHVEQMVEKSLKNLQSTYVQMQQVETELQAFLKSYLSQVSVFFEQLEQLRQEIADVDKKIYQATSKRKRRLERIRGEDVQMRHLLREKLPTLPIDLQHNAWHDEMKTIYHRLIKLYHPDTRQERYSTQVMQLINQAYEKNSIWAMREIEHSLVEHAMASKDTPESKLARLRERLDEISQSTAMATERRARLLCSEAWRIKQRMEQDKYFVEIIIHRVKMQIAQAQQILVKKRIEYKAAFC